MERSTTGHGHGDIFSMSPRTYNQTRKGAPKEFLGAQEVDLGVYDQKKLGTVVPNDWDRDPRHRTRTHLLNARKSAMFPDPTFDLDGDGIVSREDLALSLRHDLDKDHRLNTPEKREAVRELREQDPKIKFESLRPITAPHRLHHPASPLYGEAEGGGAQGTRTGLQERRRKEALEHNRAGYGRHEEALAKHVPPWSSSLQHQECVASSGGAEGAKKVRSEQLEAIKRDTRLAAGLTATMTSLNPARTSLDPVAHTSGQVRYEDQHQFTLLGYRDAPPYHTRTALQNMRHSTMLSELEAGVKLVEGTFKTSLERLKEREDQAFLEGQVAMSDPSNRVRSQLLQSRRHHNANHLISLWGRQQEPVINAIRAVSPSSRPPFWTLKDEYNPQPASQSNLDLTQSHKWYKKVPEYYLKEAPRIWGEGGKVDPYERPHHRTHGNDALNSQTIAEKITTSGSTINMVDASMRGAYVPRPVVRPEIRRDDPGSVKVPEYLTEEAKLAEDHRILSIPLYSSFSPGQVFGPVSLPSAAARPKQRLTVQQDDDLDADPLDQRRNTELGPPMKMQDQLTLGRKSRDDPAPRRGSVVRTNSFLDYEPQLSPSSHPQESPPTPPPAARSLLDRGTKVRSGGFLDSKVRPVTTGLNRPWP